jgi:adenylate kinase family enzyme
VPEKNNRIIMMGRQSGKTTIATLYLTWYALFHKSKTIAILANKAEQANEIMLRIQQAYMNLPLWLQQGIIKWNQGEMILENKCRMFSAASSSSSIRGKTVDLELVDEFAHLDDNVAEAFMQSVFPTQASRPDSMLLLISTPKGMNHFYDIWQKARSQRNSFIPCKVQWYEIDGRDEKWKDRVIRDNGIKFFAQEYACLCGNEKVTVQDDNGKILETTLKDLYEWQRDLPKPYK